VTPAVACREVLGLAPDAVSKLVLAAFDRTMNDLRKELDRTFRGLPAPRVARRRIDRLRAVLQCELEELRDALSLALEAPS
jgi:hypothetical protein